MLASLVLAAAVAAASPASQLPPPPEPVPALPSGNLLLVAGKPGNATFLATESVMRDGAIVEARTFTVYDPPLPFFGGVVQDLDQIRIDCARRTHERLSSFSYGESGEVLVWLDPAPAEPIDARNTADYVAKVLCEGLKLPERNNIAGHKAAVAATRLMMRMPGGPPTSERVP